MGKQAGENSKNMVTTYIVWDHRKRTKAGSEGPLEVCVTVDRKPYYINTGIKVRKTEWKAGTIVNRPDADSLRARLNILYKKIETEVNAAIDDGRQIDVADIKRRAWVLVADESSTSFLEWCHEQVEQLTHSEGTLKHYQTMLSRLQDFDTIRRWQDLTVENIYKWDAYLHKLTKPQSDADVRMGKQMENIILVGMPGCGKSTIGKVLAEQLGKGFIDIDEQIVKHAGMSIPEIFAQYGEEGFRKLETEILAHYGKESGLVISTGGGCVTRAENYPLIHQNGRIIWIQRDLSLLPTDGRPLSHKNKLGEMYQLRKPLYNQFADYVVDNNGTLNETIRTILHKEEYL